MIQRRLYLILFLQVTVGLCITLSPAERMIDYIKSEETFLKQVEKDATKFKPMGEKIYSYVRRAGGKGKGKAGVPDTIDENDENAVVYEAYHVGLISFLIRSISPFHRQTGILLGS